ncbi:MAG: HAMP domain-containing histidine kinase [Flavobacteriales bacterium]|nr:HAMP domain-containing histidine kinase [Flavobacteriales bacterium]MBP9080126.1 HAMP domain-containing histidine kinase [Flavobacteriales bacterium]
MPEQARRLDPADAHQLNERLHHFAHALKNRMGAIWQAASMLHDLPQGPERGQLLAMAEKNYFQAARELETLLDDLAVPRGITQLQLSQVDLLPLLERCIAHVGFRTTGKQQQVNLQATALPPVSGDPAVLEQLMEALLSNASKFSPKESVITVALGRDGQHALLEVHDQGAGLHADDLGDIFTRYAMLSSRSTNGESQARGTLARARQWAGLHGGSLSAHSAGQGQGSTFRLRLPLA